MSTPNDVTAASQPGDWQTVLHFWEKLLKEEAWMPSAAEKQFAKSLEKSKIPFQRLVGKLLLLAPFNFKSEDLRMTLSAELFDESRDFGIFAKNIVFLLVRLESKALQSEGIIRFVFRLSSSKDPVNRANVVLVLQKIRTEQAFMVLESLASDPDHVVRQNASVALLEWHASDRE